jgi:hypothetical protein
MKTITIEGAIYFDTDTVKYGYGEKYKFFSGIEEAFSTYVPVQPHTFTVDIPDDFDPRPAMVTALEAKREKLHADFAAAVTEINAQINSLLALEAV